MLTFNGYIPKRRGLIEHLYDGRLTPLDYVVFDLLLLWADAATGIASTNGPGLVYLSGNQLKLDTVQTSLRRLEEGGYIKRPFYVQGQRGNQQIFIDKFVCTKGKLRLKTLSFADTTDWKTPAYVDITEDPTESHTEDQCDNQPVSQPVNQPSNETGKGKRETGNKKSARQTHRTERFAETRETLDPQKPNPSVFQIPEDDEELLVLPLRPVHSQQPKAIDVPPRPAPVDHSAAMDNHAWNNEDPAGFETCNFCGVKAAVIRRTGVSCVRTKGANA